MNQAENVIHVRVVPPQEYVNTYSTRRLTTRLFSILSFETESEENTPPRSTV